VIRPVLFQFWSVGKKKFETQFSDVHVMHTCNDDIGASFLIMDQFWNKDAAENSYQASFLTV